MQTACHGAARSLMRAGAVAALSLQCLNPPHLGAHAGLDAVGHVLEGAHVERLLLHPHQLRLGVAPQLPQHQVEGEWRQLQGGRAETTVSSSTSALNSLSVCSASERKAVVSTAAVIQHQPSYTSPGCYHDVSARLLQFMQCNKQCFPVKAVPQPSKLMHSMPLCSVVGSYKLCYSCCEAIQRGP